MHFRVMWRDGEPAAGVDILQQTRSIASWQAVKAWCVRSGRPRGIPHSRPGVLYDGSGFVDTRCDTFISTNRMNMTPAVSLACHHASLSDNEKRGRGRAGVAALLVPIWRLQAQWMHDSISNAECTRGNVSEGVRLSKGPLHTGPAAGGMLRRLALYLFSQTVFSMLQSFGFHELPAQVPAWSTLAVLLWRTPQTAVL